MKPGMLRVWAKEFLESQAAPQHIDEIIKYISGFHKTNWYNLLSNLRKNKQFVIFRKKYVGLAGKKYDIEKWEKETPEIKRVTVGSLAEEFLAARDTPATLSEISAYVGKFKAFSRGNIEPLIRLRKNTFIFIEARYKYVGLQSKNYDVRKLQEQGIIKRSVSDLIKEFLAQQDTPCHTKEIAQYVAKFRPGIGKEDISGFLVHGKDSPYIFPRRGFVGLKSKKYSEKDLARWQNKREKTIRELVYSFLAAQDAPCHIKAITRYVKKFKRKTDESNVLGAFSRLKDTYTFYGHGYIGLKTKKYDLKKLEREGKLIIPIPPIKAVGTFLNKRRGPCSYDDILKYVEKRTLLKTRDALIKLLHRHKKVFIFPVKGYAGLKSKKYDLKAWKAKNIIKIGSVKEIAASFLARRNYLCHHNEVAAYVKKFRKSRIYHIKKYIRTDWRFVTYKNGYVGVWGKTYPDKELKGHKLIRATSVSDIIRQMLRKTRKTPLSIKKISERISYYQQVKPVWVLGQIEGDSRFSLSAVGEVTLRRKKPRQNSKR